MHFVGSYYTDISQRRSKKNLKKKKDQKNVLREVPIIHLVISLYQSGRLQNKTMNT